MRWLGRGSLLERRELAFVGFDLDAIDICRPRAVPRPRDHRGDRVRGPLDQGLDVAVQAIANPASELERGGPASHRVTKSHALHAADDNQMTGEILHGRGV